MKVYDCLFDSGFATAQIRPIFQPVYRKVRPILDLNDRHSGTIMSQNYSEQLGQWVKETEPTKRDKNVVAFLAVHEDARVALDAGYTAKTVWRNLRASGRIEFCYSTFLLYVKRFIRQKSAVASQLPVQVVAPGSIKKSSSKTSPSNATTTTSQPATGFTFNATPRKEDLL